MKPNALYWSIESWALNALDKGAPLCVCVCSGINPNQSKGTPCSVDNRITTTAADIF